jgi:DNA polymerase (family 10)
MKESKFPEWISLFREHQNKLPIKTLMGAEIDITKLGKLSVGQDTIKLLDFVVLSAHQAPGVDLENRYIPWMQKIGHWNGIKVLAHPITRNLRKGVMANDNDWNAVNWTKIFTIARQNKFYLELNGIPERMDLDWTLVRLAKGLGCKFLLSSDAHSADQIEAGMKLALITARKAHLTKHDVLNCYLNTL